MVQRTESGSSTALIWHRKQFNQIEEVKDEEQERYDNLPEGLQNAERGEQMQENADNLEEFIGYLEEVDALEEM